MDKFTKLTAIAAPLLRQNVDTDVIIRIERLIESDRRSLGPFAFEAWRFQKDGAENPDFLLNKEPYRRAKILLNGPNFGCGSSREGAVWALMGLGYRCVIAPSFGEIFFNNCFQNGVLPVVLPMQAVQELADEVSVDPEMRPLTIDLEACRVVAPSGKAFSFEIDPLRRTGLLEGLDEVGLTLLRMPEIAAFQATDRKTRPWVYQTK